MARKHGDTDYSSCDSRQQNFLANSLSRLLLVLLILVVSTTSAAAEELIIAGAEKIMGETSRRHALYGAMDTSNPLGEDIDLMSGHLGFSHTDLVLPGNGPEIMVTRTWSVSRNSFYYNFARRTGALQDWDLAVPEIETSLLNRDTSQSMWSVTGSSPLSRCSNFGEPVSGLSPQFWWRGVRLKVPGQSEQMLVRRDASNNHVPGGQTATYPIVTNGNWAISCLSSTKNNDGGEGFLATSPNGDKYWFNWYSQQHFGDEAAYYGTPINLSNQSPPDMTVAGMVTARLRVTRIEDRHGNYVLYSYAGDDVNRIEASDGRFVNFMLEQMEPGGLRPYKRVTGVEYSDGKGGLQQISYQYEETRGEYPVRIHRHLKTVTYPDGAAWIFDLANANGICNYQRPDAIQAYKYSCHHADTYAGIIGIAVSIRSPSGLTAAYVIHHGEVRRWAENCSHYGRMNGSNPPCLVYPIEPAANYAPKLNRKVYSGPGVQSHTWLYNYFDSDVTPTTTVTNPDGSFDAYKFGAYNKYSANEGVLLSMYEGAVMQGQEVLSALRTTTYQYSQGAKVGTAPQRFVNRPQTEYLRGLNKRVIEEGGIQYVYEVTSRDGLFRPTATLHHNPNRSRSEATEYFDDTTRWVLGQTKRKSVAGIESDRVEFDANSLPWKRYQFGKLRETITYDMSSNVASGQRGTVATVSDGNNKVATLSNWKRGIPQSIKYPVTTESPSGAIQSAVVNDLGWITSVTDENVYKTCYAYDQMGRVNKITYPSETTAGVCDASAWTPTTITFAAAGNAAAYGIPAGHWRQTTLTGNGRKILIFDALWRPVVEQKLDLGNVNGTLSEVIRRYDAQGRVEFQSYPMNTNGLANYADPALKGTFTEYDALGRLTSVTQASELGPLTTTTRYTAGFKTEVTNPKLQTTTTSYLAYDQPTYDRPTAIGHPEGAITEIVRDVFGKPTAIGRRNANTTIALSRHYVYDASQQLCKVVEPETGVTVLDYDNAGNLLGSASGLNLSSLSDCNTAQAAASGRRVQRSYDTRNRVSALVFPDGNGNQRWAYWPDSLVKQITTANAGKTTYNSYTYNKRRLPIGESLGHADGETWALAHNYTPNGHLASTRYPSGQTVAYAPNALGQATQAGSYATGVSYYPNGAIKQFTYGNGVLHTMTQNARQLPDASQDAYGGTAFLSDGYDYDQNGNVAAISDGATGRNQRGNRTLTYDGLDRLTQAVSPMFGTATYGYDVLDNLTRVIAPGRDHHYCYDYDGSWQLTNVKVNGCTGSTVIGLGYDAQGNVNNKNGQGFVFDYGNRLREATGKEAYRYDGHGRRTHATQSAGAIQSMYDQTGVLRYQKNARQTAVTDYIHLGGSLVGEAEWPLGQLPPAQDYVNWSTVSGTVRYVVEESVDSLTWASVYEGSDLTWTSLARPSGTYSYRVLACNAAGVCAAVSGVTHVQRPAFNIVPMLYQIILS